MRHIIILIAVILILGACENNNAPTPDMGACEWLVELEIIQQDTCFLPQRTIGGHLIVPPNIGREIDQMAISKLKDEIIYFMDREDGSSIAHLYQLNLCSGESDFLISFDDYSNNHLRINGNEQIIYNTIVGNFGDIKIYDIENQNSLPLLENHFINEVGWASDSSFIVEEGIFLDTDPKLARVVYNTAGQALDTIFIKSGEFSTPFQNKLAIVGSEEGQAPKVYIYDLMEQSILDTYEVPNESFFQSRFLLDWLSKDELLLARGGFLLGRFDLNTQTTEIFFDQQPDDCRNVAYPNIGEAIGNGTHIFQIRHEYFYNENDEYRIRHDIVRYNMETGVEEVLVF
jgi:hypothetical protein